MNLRRKASGPLPGFGGASGSASRHRSQPALARWVTRCSVSAAASRLGDQVKELAPPRRPGDPRATQRGQRRIVGLEHGEFGYIGPVDHPAHGTLAQIGGEGRYLG